jgi:hypothetical protein
MTAVRTITVGELLTFLEQGVAGEELGQASGDGVPACVLDGGDAAPAVIERAASLVGSLPCVVLAPADADPSIAPLADVFVPTSHATAITTRMAATPLAAVTLAVALRGSERRSVGDGLAAESAAYSMLLAGREFAAWRRDHPTRLAAHRRDDPPLRLHRHGATLDVTLDRPHVRNAWSTAMRDAMVEALQLAAADRTIEHIEVRGAGPSFCSGGDLDEFGTFPDPVVAHATRLARSPARLLAMLGDRVTSHLHGACFGAGIELPAFGRQVIAAPDTTIALPELSMGLVPGAGGTVSLPRRIGRHRTALLALSGIPIDAATALEWGLVDRIV